ncbi:MAG: hypothetical protein ACHQ49_10070 [Elusimicrobiota bacterium]
MIPASELITRWGSFSNPDLELRYRRDQLHRDAELSALFLLVVVVFAMLLLKTDYGFFGLTRAFAAMIASRIVLVGALLTAAYALRRARAPWTYDRVLMAAVMMMVVYALVVSSMRPPSFLGYLPVGVILVASIYAAFPLPLALQSIPAVLLTAGIAACVRRSGLSGPSLSSSLTAFGLANVLGVLASIEFQKSKRKLFLAALRQSELRGDLEKALAEVRTLRGIIPICAHCKKIRDRIGEWHSVEEYVRIRTHAQFSHGVCPECETLHYAD